VNLTLTVNSQYSTVSCLFGDLVIYDLPDSEGANKGRTRLHKLLSGYRKWTQYSVFECFLTKNFKGGTRHVIYPWNQSKTENRKSSSPRIYPWGQSQISNLKSQISNRLTAVQFVKLQQQVEKLIKPVEDSVRI
jgi:CRISPR-associated endonuclease Cas2